MKPITIGQTITDRRDASLGLYLKDVSKQPMIDINEEISLSKRIKNGDESAVNELVKSNLRFVISVAKQYQNKGLPLVDLIQEGNLGLLEAARKYDESKGFKFISYAVWWIRQAIMRAISDQCRTVRVPMNQLVSLSKLNKSSEKFEQINKRKPSIEELEEETNITFDKIALTYASVNKTLSLDTKFSEDGGTLLDILPNKNAENSDDNIIYESVSKEIQEVLDKLSDRESDVLKMFFGLGMSPMTLEEIAVRFGVGSERVRQIQNEAIAKIKGNYSDLLKELL